MEQLNTTAGLSFHKPSTDSGIRWLDPLLNKCLERFYPKSIFARV